MLMMIIIIIMNIIITWICPLIMLSTNVHLLIQCAHAPVECSPRQHETNAHQQLIHVTIHLSDVTTNDASS